MTSLFSTLDILEYPIIRYLQNIDGTWLDGFSMLVSNITLMLAGFSIVVGYMIWKRHRLWKPLLVSLMLSGIVSSIVNEGILKMWLTDIGIFRPRPWTIHPDIIAIGHAFRDSSFPSSHMAFTTLLVMIVSYYEKRFLKYGVILIILMGLSRVHNGMHYPSDVVIGGLLGIFYGLVGLALMKWSGLEKMHWWERWFR